jgi:TonB-dependent receptor
MEPTGLDRSRRRLLACSSLGLALLLGLVLPLGIARAEPDSEAPAGAAQIAAEGSVTGTVLDAGSAQPVTGVAVTLTWPAAEGEEPQSETRVTGADGSYEFTSVPVGVYGVRFEKASYRPALVKSLAVEANQPSRVDISLPRAAEAAEEPTGVEEFTVIGTKAEAIEASRAESDKLINTLSAAEMSKFAASDVADALKFVPGVSVVKGQFAIIRGLEDRYSSTLYNSAPIPSPDPDRQSVQLDLFPSEVVSNLVVAKTFAPELPSNSSGGSINIITHDYPERLEIRGSTAFGINDNAADRFVAFDGGSSVGREKNDPLDLLGNEFGLSVAGRSELVERELRYKLVLNRERAFDTETGFQEGREPRISQVFPVPKPHVTRTGDLSLGRLSLSDGRFDLTQSEGSEDTLGYGGFGFDLDKEGNHKIDVSAFYSQKKERTVELKENGFLPGFDYGALATKQMNHDDVLKNSDFECCATPGSWISRTVRPTPDFGVTNGPMWFTNFSSSTAFATDRDLLVGQINGDHRIDALDGLHVTWAGNYARTTQGEDSRGTRIFFEPADPNLIPARIPPSAASLAPGLFATSKAGILTSGADIEETQYFARLDADYETTVVDALTLKLNLGGWYENSRRGASASFLQEPTINSAACDPTDCVGSGSNFVIFGDTANEVGHTAFDTLTRDPNGDFSSLRNTSNRSSREITAGDFGVKATLWDRVDLLGGGRLERLLIESKNNPFIGEISPINGAPTIFPTAFLFFDRLDNPALGEVSAAPPAGTVFNDQILGIRVPVEPSSGLVDLITRSSIESLVNGKIDETRLLPSAGIAYRPFDGVALRGAYSQTVARPSFREIGYYVSVEPGSDDLIVGNPQLKLSDVESYDLRGEYSFGDFGDLVAVSGFYKKIQDPIESIVIRNPVNFEAANSALFRTFFNNPNQASLWGIEAEGRKNLGFVGLDFAQYFSVGTNFTYIDAKVDRTEAELARSRLFFGVAGKDINRFPELKKTRRLFGQPQWIANADLSFDQPDWGTKATLAFFAISDVLDAAGTANIGPDGKVFSFTLDRYVDSYSRLDLILSQTVHADLLGGDVVFKLSVKNLTDTTRRVIYDPSQTLGRIAERSYKVGRDFKITLSYAF